MQPPARMHEFVVNAKLNLRQLSPVLVERFPELQRYSLGTIDQDINAYVNTLGHRIKHVVKAEG